jgi:hypothetical protein
MRWMTAVALLIPTQEGVVELDLLNKENVVASRLEGAWKASPDLTPGGVNPVPGELAFAYDREAVPEGALKKMAARAKTKLTVYALGKATRIGKPGPAPFALTFWNGNPTLLLFEEENGDPFGKWSGCRVAFARAKDSKDDILYLVIGERGIGASLAFTRVR